MRKGRSRLRRLAPLAVLVGLAALTRGTVRADVEPGPAWRIGDGVSTVALGPDTIYLGGAFTQLYTPSSAEEQFYDVLTGQVRNDCARLTNTSRTLTGVPDGLGGLLVPMQDGDTFADVNGEFTPPAGTTILRITETCLWDRPFAATAIDPNAPDDLTIGRPARVGGIVVAANTVYVPERLSLRAQAASFDAASGARLSFRFYEGVSEMTVLGATSTRVIVSVRGGFGGTRLLGAIDPASLELTQSSSLLADEDRGARSWVRGDRLYRWRPSPANIVEAFDLATLAPVTGWTPPVVPSLLDLDVANGRVFLTARQVNGQTVMPPAALAAASGALDGSWTSPDLTRRLPEPGGTPYVPTLTALATDGQRLYMSGDFERVGGVDREGVAALSTAGGGLDAWDSAPFVVSPIETTLTAVLMTRPTGINRMVRRYLAAVDRETGLLTEWNPNDAARVLLHTPAAVGALAADPAWVYFAGASTGEVLRADTATADVDPAWRLVVTQADGSPGAVTSLVLANGLLYLGGSFERISGATFGLTTRRSLAAVTASGALADWAPELDGPSGVPLLRSMLALGPSIYLGGEFTAVNLQFRTGFAAVDAISGTLSLPETYVQGETRVYGLATDGDRVFAGGVTFGAALVGAVTPPDSTIELYDTSEAVAPASVAFTAGRVYAGREYDPDTAAPTSRATRWGTVFADEAALLHLTDDAILEYYPSLPGNPPGPPTLTATSAGNTVTASWAPDPTGGAPGSYTLFAGSAPGAANLAAIPIRGATSFSATAPTGLYYLTVVARNGYGVSAPSNEVAVQAGCVVAPPAPASASYTRFGTSVAIGWVPSATAVSYQLEAGLAPGVMNLGAIPLGNVTTFSTAAPLGLYYVRIRAVNACGVSPPSAELVVNLDGAMPAPAAPTGLAAVVAGRTVSFVWSAPTSGGTPSAYQIEAGTTPGGTIAVLPTTATALVVPDAPAGTFYVRVRAVNAAGASAATPDVAVVIP